jgi:glyoxylase-like metal-dependent hydrolase (beta-lactamase superfamily II)
VVRIRHLNCCTIRVPAGHAMIGTGGLLGRAEGVTHCVLVETNEGLLLIDTGMGRQDCLSPTFFMRWMIAVGGFPRDLHETAHAQVQQLGYAPQDVRHIALTHLHFDHAGGLPDFPWAQVHVYVEEHEAVTQLRDMYERYPYRREHWAHGPHWAPHALEGDDWYRFACTPYVDLGGAGFCFVPLTGHTRGHSGVALHTNGRWLLHCGDAYTYHGDVDPVHPSQPSYSRLFRLLFHLNKAFRQIGKHSPRLRALLDEHRDEVTLTCSHDPHGLEVCRTLAWAQL